MLYKVKLKLNFNTFIIFILLCALRTKSLCGGYKTIYRIISSWRTASGRRKLKSRITQRKIKRTRSIIMRRKTKTRTRNCKIPGSPGWSFFEAGAKSTPSSRAPVDRRGGSPKRKTGGVAGKTIGRSAAPGKIGPRNPIGRNTPEKIEVKKKFVKHVIK